MKQNKCSDNIKNFTLMICQCSMILLLSLILNRSLFINFLVLLPNLWNLIPLRKFKIIILMMLRPIKLIHSIMVSSYISTYSGSFLIFIFLEYRILLALWSRFFNLLTLFVLIYLLILGFFPLSFGLNITNNFSAFLLKHLQGDTF